MKNMEESKKAEMNEEKRYRFGIWLLYLCGFSIYFYFMNVDRYFEGSMIPTIIAFLAYLLIVPVAILPEHWYLNYRTWRLAKSLGNQNDSFSHGNKLALTSDGKLLVFLADSKWLVKNSGAIFGKGTIQFIPAPEEAVSIHKGRQEHLVWSRIVFRELHLMDLCFVIGNLALLSFPVIHQPLLEQTDSDLFTLLFISMGLMVIFILLRKHLMASLFDKKKNFIQVTNTAYKDHELYARLNNEQVLSTLSSIQSKYGCETKFECVTLNGGLIYSLHRNGNLIEYMTIL